LAFNLFEYWAAIYSTTCLAFCRRSIIKMLFIGLILNMGVTLHPAAAPEPSRWAALLIGGSK
jgi:hypothetical protein